MPLKMTAVTVYEVDSYDLEQFINEQYPAAKSYSFVASTECGNDSQHEYNVQGVPLDKWSAEDVTSFSTGKRASCSLQDILNDLCNRDLIPAGTYLIKVCW